MIDLEAPAIYEKIIQETDHEQVRLVISTFRGIEYISLRKYYLDFDEEWKPTRDGIALPIDLDNLREIFTALVEILSISEVKGVLETHFKEILDELYQD